MERHQLDTLVTQICWICTENALIDNISGDMFKPNQTVTRGELAQTLYRYLAEKSTLKRNFAIEVTWTNIVMLFFLTLLWKKFLYSWDTLALWLEQNMQKHDPRILESERKEPKNKALGKSFIESHKMLLKISKKNTDRKKIKTRFSKKRIWKSF